MIEISKLGVQNALIDKKNTDKRNTAFLSKKCVNF